MKTHFEILIDASGSMGYMKNTTEENKYLLPDKSTRTDLVKKIILNNILPNLTHAKELTIKTFRGVSLHNDKKELVCYKDSKRPIVELSATTIYNNSYNLLDLEKSISDIENPPVGGTPLCKALLQPIIKHQKSTVLLITDGDSNDVVNFHINIINKIRENKHSTTIFIIGIDQNEKAQNKRC